MNAGRVTRVALAVAIAGTLLVVVGIAVEPSQALTSYLFAYMTILTVVIGALLQIMIGHLTGARWFTPFRDDALIIVGALPAMALLLLPVLLGVHRIYPWSNPGSLAVDVRAVVGRKQEWLNVPFFVARAVLYVGVWLAVGERLRSLSRSLPAGEPRDVRDASVRTDQHRARQLRQTSAGGSIAVGVTLTFAAFDWMMSLEPAWYSTIYGVYVFAGGILAALGLIALVAWSGFARDAAGFPSADDNGSLGKLLFTFTIFWGYIGFSQYLIIWIADVPHEAAWYLSRTQGSWGVVAVAIAVGQFAIPFCLLLSRSLKRRPEVLAAIGAWLLVVHALDFYWLVLPALHPGGMALSWTDAAALAAVGGWAVAAAALRAPSLHRVSGEE